MTTMNTAQRYPPRRCFDAESANSELGVIAKLAFDRRRSAEDRFHLMMVGPTVIARDCTSSARPFAVPRDAEPGV